MNRVPIVLSLFLSLSISGFAVDLDPAYLDFFKPGTIAVSSRGMPAKGAFDAKLFEYRDGRFVLPLSQDLTIDLRALLPAGQTLGKAYAATVARFAAEVSSSTRDIIIWRAWRSHDEAGRELTTASAPWPMALGEVPAFADPVVTHTAALTQDSLGWNSAALSWNGCFVDDLQPTLKAAKAGQRLYLLMTVGFETSGADGKTRIIHSEPLAAATIEWSE